jgi:hypothetical protein
MRNAFLYKGLSVELWDQGGSFARLSPAQVANRATELATGAGNPALCPQGG